MIDENKTSTDSKDNKITSETKDVELTADIDGEETEDIELPIELKEKIVNLENFTLIENLGHGKFGSVYLGEEKSSHEKYAIKMSFSSMYFRIEEALILAQNDYPALITLRGYSLTDFEGLEFPVLIIDYMENGNLEKYLEKPKGTNRNTKIYIILLGIAIGMNHLHQRNIAHRDLKPENILLDNNLFPHIADFGFSRKIPDGDGLLTTQCFTPLYAAPEILNGEDYTIKIDIYSFSIIAYQLLTNKKPYPKSILTLGKLQSYVLGKNRPSLEKIKNDKIISLLEDCWSSDPSNRPSFDEIIELMTDKQFYGDFGIVIPEVIEYLDIFGDEFKNLQEKLMADNRIETQSSDYYSDND